MMLLELHTGLFSIIGHTIYTAVEQKATKMMKIKKQNRMASLNSTDTFWNAGRLLQVNPQNYFHKCAGSLGGNNLDVF